MKRSLERTYSASPAEVFFTGGGAHTFSNFDPRDNGRVLSIREATRRSTNLVFIRLMRDVVRFHQARLPYDPEAVLADPAHPERRRMLHEMAEQEAREILTRAYRSYRGLQPGEIVERFLGARAGSSRALSILFFAWRPEARTGGSVSADFSRWLEARTGRPAAAAEGEALARAFGNPQLGLLDYAYLLGRHPLELSCAGALVENPDLSWRELWAQTSGARELAASWLLQTRHRKPQDMRLRVHIEQDAFARMTPYWRRLGFPFERLTPSYATAIGNSSDRPNALAELMGIIVNDGVRLPAVRVRKLRFASGTPYHTVLEPVPPEGERVLAAPVARALRAVLAEVVESGTARRVAGAFAEPDGTPIVVGGKTGSGDNRFEAVGRGGHVRSSRVVNRTAAFVFYIGDRYFGVLTASVEGKEAGDYRFTSALPVAVLRLLAPSLNPLISPESGSAALPRRKIPAEG